METIIIQREEKTTRPVELTLPYYATFKPWGTDRYCAITGETGNIQIMDSAIGLPMISDMSAKDLPADHTPITEEQFREAFDTAISKLQEKACQACPSYL